MQELTATQARTLTQESLVEKEKKEKENLAKKKEEEMELTEDIKCLNRAIKNAAEDTKTHLKISAYWHSKYDKKLEKHFRELGYSVRIKGLNCWTRRFCISWNPNPFKRFWEVFF